VTTSEPQSSRPTSVSSLEESSAVREVAEDFCIVMDQNEKPERVFVLMMRRKTAWTSGDQINIKVFGTFDAAWKEREAQTARDWYDSIWIETEPVRFS
jgi:hypothetical protein